MAKLAQIAIAKEIDDMPCENSAKKFDKKFEKMLTGWLVKHLPSIMETACPGVCRAPAPTPAPSGASYGLFTGQSATITVDGTYQQPSSLPLSGSSSGDIPFSNGHYTISESGCYLASAMLNNVQKDGDTSILKLFLTRDEDLQYKMLLDRISGFSDTNPLNGNTVKVMLNAGDQVGLAVSRVGAGPMTLRADKALLSLSKIPDSSC